MYMLIKQAHASSTKQPLHHQTFPFKALWSWSTAAEATDLWVEVADLWPGSSASPRHIQPALSNHGAHFLRPVYPWSLTNSWAQTKLITAVHLMLLFSECQANAKESFHLKIKNKKTFVKEIINKCQSSIITGGFMHWLTYGQCVYDNAHDRVCVSVSLGCQNKMPQTGRHKQQTFLSYSSGGWKSEIQAPWAGFWWRLSCSQTAAFSLSPHMPSLDRRPQAQGEEGLRVLCSSSWEDTHPLGSGPQPSDLAGPWSLP